MRRALALAGVLMAIAAVVVFVVQPGGDGAGGPVPEAGSRFRDDAGAARQIGTGRDQLPLERAVAQVFAGGFQNRRGPIRGWGALLVSDANFVSAAQLRQAVRRASRTVLRRGASAPLVIGDPQRLGRLGTPVGSVLGAAGGPAEARAMTRRAARRLRRAGVGMVLSPPADLAIGGGPAELRAFGDDPALVARYVRATVEGWRDAEVLAAPGRFPGEGGASQDPIAGPATVGLSLDELRARDLRPFAAAATRAPAMQMSAALYAAWDGVTPATLLPEAVRLLRRDLRFRGAIVSADLVAATAATGEGVDRAAVEALKAGCDLLLVPGGRAEQERAFRGVVEAVRRGDVPRSRLEEALRRVRALKAAAA